MIAGKVPFFFAGTDGATSVKAELVGRVPLMKDASSYREARRLLTEDLGGYKTLREELIRCGFVDETTGDLTASPNPFNIFAMIAAGKIEQPGMQEEQERLGDFANEYLICCNRPVCDEYWDSEDPEWLGKASMSRRHRFLTTKKKHWQWFNALSFGLVPFNAGGCNVAEALTEVERMKAACLLYASRSKGWSDKVGLFVHVFGHNTVNSLHVHILDMSELGPSYWKQEFKNCPLDAVIKVLKEELIAQDGPQQGLKMATEAAVVAARAASEAAQAIMAQTTSKTRPSKKGSNEVLTLNVGGEMVTVSRDTVLLAPAGSLLLELFQADWASPKYEVDDGGNVFLDYPPGAFKLISNQLRMLHLTPRNEVLQPPSVPRELARDYSDLARLLGLGGLVAMGEAQWGRGPIRENLQPRGGGGFCGKRRPRGPPPKEEEAPGGKIASIL